MIRNELISRHFLSAEKFWPAEIAAKNVQENRLSAGKILFCALQNFISNKL